MISVVLFGGGTDKVSSHLSILISVLPRFFQIFGLEAGIEAWASSFNLDYPQRT